MANEVKITVSAEDRTKQALASVNQSLNRLKGSAEGVRPGMGALNSLTKDLTSGMTGMAGRAGVVGRALAALGPAGIAASAGIGAMLVTLGKATQVGGEFETMGLRTEAILKATGQASGQTAESIRKMSEDIARSTLASVRGVEGAAQKLMTFRNVGEDVFRRTLEAAQDLSAVGFGSIDSAAVQLGKALEDPIQGMTALTRVGVSFSQKQKDVVRELMETNRVADAQKLILAAVESQVGGAGRAEAGGLAGAYDTLGQSVETFYKKLGESGSVQMATSALNGLANAIDALNRKLFPDVEQQIENARSRLATLQGQSERGRGALGGLLTMTLDREIQQTEELIQTLEKEIRTREEATEAAKRQAAEAKRLAEEEHERAEAQRKLAEEQARLARLEEERAKQSAALHARIEAMVEQLRRQAATLGMTALEAELYRLKLEGASGAQLAAARAALSAIEAHKAQAQALREAAEAAAELEREQQALNDQMERSAAAVLDTLDPMRALRREYKALEELHEANLLTYEEWAEATARVEARMYALAEGAETAGASMSEFAIQAARNMQSAFAEFLFDPFEEGLRGMLFGFIQTLRRMSAELLAAEALKGFFNALSGAGGGGQGNQFGQLFATLAANVRHSGGLAGEGPTRQVPAAAFLAAPRLHDGGILGLKPNEVPAILERGEEVLRRDSARHSANGGEQQGVRIVNVIDPALAADYLTSSAGERTILNVLARNAGAVRQVLA